MKIAYVVHDYNNRAGHSRYVYELARRFAADHEVHVYANRIDGARDGRIRFHHVPAWRGNALAAVLSFVVPATLLVGRGFDVIHAQGLCGLRQHVVTAHMCLAGWHDAQRRFQGRLTWRQRLWRLLAQPLERLIFQARWSTRVIAVSAKAAADLHRHYGRSQGVSVIGLGVDWERFHPGVQGRDEIRRELRVNEREILALYVGDLQKGATAALRTLANVPGVRLAFVSPTPPGPWQVQAKTLGLTARVTFCPMTDRIERYYAAANVFFFPTYYDTFGLVIAEALACGLPVLTTRAAGAAELLTDGTDALLVVDPADTPALAAALARLASDPDLRKRLGAAGRQTIAGHTWDAVAAATLSVYEDIAWRGRR
jgi:UDP-glucose:(heptosyl)LPS alpha-1,3-glucosyltransferase